MPVPDEAEARAALEAAGLMPPGKPVTVSKEQQAINDFFDIETLPGHPVVVESLIGQVNGRPVYADDVLGPITDQLRAEYERLSWQQFKPLMEQLVMQRLQEVTLNELFLAEARASLSEQQQHGLMGFLKQLEQDVVGRSGGVHAKAEQAVLAQEGRTLEEYLELEEERVLIQQLMNDRVRHQAVVSWHDIDRAYKARLDEFQPAGRIVIGRIRLRTADTEAIAQVQQALDADSPFSAVATEAGLPDGGVWESFELPESGIQGLEITDAYKLVLEGLKQGQVSAPLQRGAFTMWFAILDHTQGEQRSLYDPAVQRQLQLELYSRAVVEAQNEFVKDVLQRGIYDEMALMHNRAITIAATRFPPR
jgi:hypothetical protein